MSDTPGIHLTRTDENVDEIEALAGLVGGRAGLAAVLGDLDHQGRRAFLGGRLLGRAVHRAYTWDAADRRDPRWWPQGVTTSADASDTEDVEGRRVLAVSWYAKELPGDERAHGSRITLLDLDTRRYAHVLLVVPILEGGALTLEPLHVHAGGIVWLGPYLHIAATARGVVTCRLDDLMRVPSGSGLSTFGYRYVLPVRFSYRAVTGAGMERLRYSFLSLDRAAEPMQLVVGEYGNSSQTRRLARYPLDPETLVLAAGDDGATRPLGLDEEGAVRMQGAAIARGTWYVTASTGPTVPGSVYVGHPGSWRRHRWATPMGPEDIAWWPSTDLLWSVTEHPRRRWVFSMKRSWFDR
jgi:hypothetical protein